VTTKREDSNAFLEKLRTGIEDEGGSITENSYQDVTFYVAEAEPEMPTVFGTLGNLVVFTTSQDAMEKAIDTYQGGRDSISKNDRYVTLMQEMPQDAILHTYLDLQSLLPALKDISSEELDLPGDDLGSMGGGVPIEAYQALGVAVTLDKEGIKVDSMVTFDAEMLSPEDMDLARRKANPNQILNHVPNDALVFVAAQDLATAWRTSVENNPSVQEQLDQLSDMVGIPLDENLFEWATGEFALVLTDLGGDTGFGFFAIFETDDPDAALSAMDDIADSLSEMGVVFETETIKGVEMQIFVDPYTDDILFGYGLTDNYLIIGFTEDALNESAEPDSPITDDKVFQIVQAKLPKENSGYVYISTQAISDALDEDMGPWIEPIEAIGMASEVSDPSKGVVKSTIYIYIP
jgi:hypothetical protein